MKPIDTHAHVFTAACPLAPDRRYTPRYEAPIEAYLAELDKAGVGHAVLVQPSFLGTDNGYLVEALQVAAGRLRGVAVVEPAVQEPALDRLADAGVVGIRLNLIGREAASLAEPQWNRLCRRVAERGWLIQVQADGPQLAGVLPMLQAIDAPVVIDHFGRPEPERGVDDPGFRALLAAAPQGRIKVKLSAPYRCGHVDVQLYAQELLTVFGPNHLLWGSDWPWTQHEDGRTYPQSRAWLTSWVPDLRARRIIECRTPSQLFGFG